MKRLGIFRTILVNFGGQPTGLIRIGEYSRPNLHGYEEEICITPDMLSIGEIRAQRDLLVHDLNGTFEELERRFRKAEAEAEANPEAWPMFPSEQDD